MHTGAPLRLVLLDVDGTLVDSLYNICTAMDLACSWLKIPAPPHAHMRRGIGLSLIEAVAQAVPDQPASVHERLAEAYKDAFVEQRARPDHQEHLFPGTIEVLAALDAEGWLMGLATGKSRRGVDSFIERHGFHQRFVTIHTADDGPGKPDPAMILSALANTGCSPQDTVMVGDTTYDMAMARSARVGAIGVPWGSHPVSDLRQAGAQEILDDFAGLPAAVRALIPTA
jgi:phosphoglycolate phosphatase